MSPARLLVHGVGPVDLGRTACAVGLAAVVEIGLHTLPLPRLCGLLGVPLVTEPRPGGPGGGEVVRVPRWARHRLAASRRAMRHWPFGGTCLRTALVGGCLIRRLDPALRIGVAKQDGAIKAHAWIELAGVSLDPGSADFAVVEDVLSA